MTKILFGVMKIMKEEAQKESLWMFQESYHWFRLETFKLQIHEQRTLGNENGKGIKANMYIKGTDKGSPGK